MSYDRIFFRNPSASDTWLKLYPGENLSEEIEQEYTRLYERGNMVAIAAGKNLCVDELFLFQDPADAKRFYESRYRQWERFDEGKEEGYGFDHVELYVGRSFVARKKQLPPHHRMALQRQRTSFKGSFLQTWTTAFARASWTASAISDRFSSGTAR